MTETEAVGKLLTHMHENQPAMLSIIHDSEPREEKEGDEDWEWAVMYCFGPDVVDENYDMDDAPVEFGDNLAEVAEAMLRRLQ